MNKKTIMMAVAVAFLVGCSKKRNESKKVVHDKANEKVASYTANLKEGKEKDTLIKKLIKKRKDSSLVTGNMKFLSNYQALEGGLDGAGAKFLGDVLKGHTQIYHFKGRYKVLVIPVQFSDVKFSDPQFFTQNPDGVSQAQDYLFGKGAGTMSTYYKHASFGKLNLQGEVANIVTVEGTIADYGEAVTGRNDKNARGLVVAALEQVQKAKTDAAWWSDFDNWDLSDYDKDFNFHEPDGFIDSVILIYAGKSQASCQRAFDPDGNKPASTDVPEGPKHGATVECFNRIWPHRWAISLPSTDPRYSENGPLVEGALRSSMNGLKISESLFALDYNMQSEYSDRSTFIHEFGHSLSLPDIYSPGKDGNSTGFWTVMSSNANQQAQEFGSFSKLALGWLTPKMIKQGEKTSAYLGVANYVSNNQRENLSEYLGPNKNAIGESILSKTPEYNEDVYRSLLVLTDPSESERKVVDFPEQVGKRAAYSGKFDSGAKSYQVKLKVPADNPILTFDTIYHIETETNFFSEDKEIKIVTDFDIGQIVINNKVHEDLRIVSGDENYDTLAELNPLCAVKKALALRTKNIEGTLSEDEEESFNKILKICQAPIWVKKKIDLTEFVGEEITFEMRLTTDAGYTEFGIVIDNIELGDMKIDFESNERTGDFQELLEGKEKVTHNQFYLMEYRSPSEEYSYKENLFSYNMDNNIVAGSQAMFLQEGETLLEKFRMFTYDYRPGVVVWYFNSKMGHNNNAVENNGEGFLLVLNSEVQELKMPGIFSSETEIFDEAGHYRDEDDDPIMRKFLAPLRDDFICFSHIAYATYQKGEAPKCEKGFEDYMQKLTFKGLKLQYRRERFNEWLPRSRYASYGVGKPFRNTEGIRTGLSPFSPAGTGDYSPFKVYKEEEGQMVLDQKLTASSPKFKSIHHFSDADNKVSEYKRFKGDSVVVEKKGMRFDVAMPGQRILDSYNVLESGDDNNQYYRRPRAKIYINWQ